MPLTPGHQDAFQDDLYVGVVFAMLAGDTRVVCRVTKAALEDKLAKNGRRETAVHAFCRLRSEIEAVASRQYDEGAGKPVIESEDLVPLRIPVC